MFNPLFLCVYFDKIPLGGPPKSASFLGKRSELCEAQETRGSKFTCEFGRNSTVYCFVASDN